VTWFWVSLGVAVVLSIVIALVALSSLAE